MLIVLLAGVAGTALLVLVFPLLRRSRPLVERRYFDRIVYLDQLRELDRDASRGVLSDAEAVAARLDIQRRLLATDSHPDGASVDRDGRSPMLAAGLTAFALAGSVGVYVLMGAPAIPDTPFSARSAVAGEPSAGSGAPPAGHNDLARALGKLGDKLKANPSDADGWLLYARTAGSTRHWDEAVDGYRHAMALGRTGADVESGLGEMLVLQADGIVTPAAHDAFLAALKSDPKEDVARYYMGVAAGQAGEPRKAIDEFQTLLGEIPEDSPMRDEVVKRIAEAARAAGVAMPALAKGTPAEDTDDAAMAAMDGMPEGEQKAMIALMVSKLADRLKAEPNDPDGWMRLGRAYSVMKERDKAADAYDHAIALKPNELGIRLQAVDGLLGGLKPDDVLPSRALAILRQVETMAPEEPEVLWYLGIAAARDAHPAEARTYWTRLLAKLPADGEDARMVKGAMDSLKGG